jgi:hypothetical protein
MINLTVIKKDDQIVVVGGLGIVAVVDFGVDFGGELGVEIADLTIVLIDLYYFVDYSIGFDYELIDMNL